MVKGVGARFNTTLKHGKYLGFCNFNSKCRVHLVPKGYLFIGLVLRILVRQDSHNMNIDWQGIWTILTVYAAIFGFGLIATLFLWAIGVE